MVIWFPLSLFVNNRKRAPIDGSKIIEDKIGKFIILRLKRLAEQKNQLTLQMRIDIYIHFEIY